MAINQLKLVGKNSGDIFVLRYPKSLLDFCSFDFSAFAKSAIDLCNEALKNGNPDYDRISDLRKEIQSAHCYIENNIRTVYDKVVFDCWIDYVCRRDNIGESGLWNRLIRCKTPFDKAIFARLCEFRYNRASNEWLNIIRVQDYAKSKLEFVFAKSLDSVDEAAARRNYFDMMFSVTAREMGCRLEDLGVTKIFSIGRIPPAPFMFPNVSKEIVRHVLVNFDYSDDYSDIGDYSESSDQIAMDAFSRMKAGLPKDLAGYNISSNITDKHNGKIYMPCSLKAAVDLEFDAIIDDGAWLARCKRCKRFFLRNREHPEEYCSRSMPGEKSCLELYEEEHPRPTITSELEKRCRDVTDEVYSRVDKTMSVKEYDSWHLYLEAMIAKVKNGEIPSSDLENFLDYSLEVDISKSHPIMQVEKREQEPTRERVVKPFIPERISRSDLPAAEPKFEEPEPIVQAPKEGFFTSPIVQRQKSERPQISHIIRNGESLGDNGSSVKPDPSGFRPFGAPPVPPTAQKNITSGSTQNIRAADFPQFAPSSSGNEETLRQPTSRSAGPHRSTAYEKLNLLEERIEAENRIRRELAERMRSGKQNSRTISETSSETVKPVSRFGKTSDQVEPIREERVELSREERFESSREECVEPGREERFEPSREERVEPSREERFEPNRKEHVESGREERADLHSDERLVKSEKAPEETTPKTRVIRKNAAAISAYGKMSGAAFTTADPLEKQVPETDPFKDIGSIFDVLEQSETDGGRSSYETRSEENARNPENIGERRDSRDTSERYYDPRGTRGDVSDERYFDPGGTRRDTSERYYDPRGVRGDVSEERYYDPRETRRDASERYYDPRETRGGTSKRYYDPRKTRGDTSERYYDPRDTQGEAADENDEPSGASEEREFPQRVTNDNVPNGIWTEERHLFPHNENDGAVSEPSENTVKEKRHKSTKTQRLYDMITREPDDNPNFRKK